MYYRRDIGHRALKRKRDHERRHHTRRTAGLERSGVRLLESSPRRQPQPARSALRHRRRNNVQEFVRHIWGAELRWAQRLAGVARNCQGRRFPPARSTRSSICTPRPIDIFRNTARRSGRTPGAIRMFLTSTGSLRSSAPSPAERSRRMRSSTASAIGRSWPHWSATPASPRTSAATCSSVLRCARLRHRCSLPVASGSTTGTAPACLASA